MYASAATYSDVMMWLHLAPRAMEKQTGCQLIRKLNELWNSTSTGPEPALELIWWKSGIWGHCSLWARGVPIWKIWYLDYSDKIITVNDIIAVFIISVQISKKHIHWDNFTKSCDSLIILKHLKPKSYQNETFTLKGQTTGTERIYFVICKQNLFGYFVDT